MQPKRIMIDLGILTDGTGAVEAKARPAYVAFLAATAALRPFAVWVTEHENTTAATLHVCGHRPDGNAPCMEVEEIGVAPIKQVAVVEAGAEAVEVGEIN